MNALSSESQTAVVSDTGQLTVAPPVNRITNEQAIALVSLETTEQNAIRAKAQAWLDELLDDDNHDAIRRCVAAIDAMGNDAARQWSHLSKRVLNRQITFLRSEAVTGGERLATTMNSLNTLVRELDPALHGDLLSERKFLWFSLGNRLDGYFDLFRSKEILLNDLIETLYRSEDDVMRDSASVLHDQDRIREVLNEFKRYISACQLFDDMLVNAINDIETSRSARAQRLKEDVLFVVRQRLQDLLTQDTVAAQGYLVLEMLAKNNAEIRRGIRRTAETTVSALRTAIMTSTAMGAKALILNNIRAMNKNASAIVKDINRETQRQQKSTQHLEQELQNLQQAFKSVYSSIEDLGQFQLQAKQNAEQTAASLAANE